VLQRFNKFFDRISIVTLFLVMVLAAYFLATEPIAYQKAMALTSTPFPPTDWSEGQVLDARAVIGAIPYRGSERVYDVLPQVLYEKCILRGLGNCANKTRGLCFYLEQNGIPFERIDLIPLEGFLSGNGHTLVQTRFMLDGVSYVGVIDMLEGAIPTFRGAPMDSNQFRVAVPHSISLATLNPRVDDSSDYYGSFLEAVAFGVVDGRSVARYFRYLDAVHVSLGDARIERLFCSASAVVLGVFPMTHVTPADYARLRGSSPRVFLAAHVLTWAARVFLVAAVLGALCRVFRFILRQVGQSLPHRLPVAGGSGQVSSNRA
jgi:hypothetical protein